MKVENELHFYFDRGPCTYVCIIKIPLVQCSEKMPPSQHRGGILSTIVKNLAEHPFWHLLLFVNTVHSAYLP